MGYKQFPARAVLAIAASAALAACSSIPMSNSMSMTDLPARKAADGTLTNAAGMTLYTFDKDSGGKSACNGPCAGNWPPFTAGADAKVSGDWSVITRDDGRKQWAYKGKPTYLWSKDQKPGDMMGDGFNGVWHVVKD